MITFKYKFECMKASHEQKGVEKLAGTLRTIGDTTRLSILCFIFNSKEACVSEIALHLKESVAITSHHLRALERDGIVVSRRHGKKILYSLARTTFVRDMRTFICKYK